MAKNDQMNPNQKDGWGRAWAKLSDVTDQIWVEEEECQKQVSKIGHHCPDTLER
jgi:hypothetical protein